MGDGQRGPPSPGELGARYDASADAYDRAMADPRMRRRWRWMERAMLEASTGASRVLELGCGSGRLLRQTRAPAKVGVDLSARMLGRAAQSGLSVARADVHRLPFGDGIFDVVLAGNGVFRYLDWERALSECARVLRPGGVLGVHQYAARFRARGGRGARPDPSSPLRLLRHAREMLPTAARRGLRCVDLRLYRPVRVPPYVVRVPRALPGHLWLHCVMVFRRVGS
jgi:SAM-dependent methyltransferase